MNVADFLQFEASFQTNSIVYTTSYEEYIRRIGILCGKPLQALLVFQNFLYLLRNRQQFGNIITILLFCDLTTNFGKLHCQAVHCCKLRTIGLRGCHRNLRACQCVKYFVCFSGNTAAYHIDNGHSGNALFFCKS